MLCVVIKSCVTLLQQSYTKQSFVFWYVSFFLRNFKSPCPRPQLNPTVAERRSHRCQYTVCYSSILELCFFIVTFEINVADIPVSMEWRTCFQIEQWMKAFHSDVIVVNMICFLRRYKLLVWWKGCLSFIRHLFVPDYAVRVSTDFGTGCSHWNLWESFILTLCVECKT